VVGVPEREEAVAARVVLRELDAGLDGVAPSRAAEDDAAVAREAAGRNLVELLDEVESGLGREVDGVRELVDLLVDALVDVGVGVPDVVDADAREEVQEDVSVDVLERRALPSSKASGMLFG